MYTFYFLIAATAMLSVEAAAQTTFSQGQGMIFGLSQARTAPIVHELNIEGPGENNRIPYNQVNGSPFWNDNWQEAELFTPQGKVGTAPVKINLVTGEIYFKKNSEEWVLQEETITRFLFKDDSSEFRRHLPHLFLAKKKFDGLVQVMNRGRYQLLKSVQRKLAWKDSLFGTQKRYFFKDEVFYFVRSAETVHQVAKQNEESFLSLFPKASAFREWIRENKLSFKKEKEMLHFLHHYNAAITRAPE